MIAAGASFSKPVAVTTPFIHAIVEVISPIIEITPPTKAAMAAKVANAALPFLGLTMFKLIEVAAVLSTIILEMKVNTPNQKTLLIFFLSCLKAPDCCIESAKKVAPRTNTAGCQASINPARNT